MLSAGLRSGKSDLCSGHAATPLVLRLAVGAAQPLEAHYTHCNQNHPDENAISRPKRYKLGCRPADSTRAATRQTDC